MNMTSIAFIGLGHMGSGMALNLLKVGFELSVFDLNQKALTEAKAHGARLSSSVKEAVVSADVILTMLPQAQHVREVLDEVVTSAPKGALIIDCSTIDYEAARGLAAKLTMKGFEMVDAPVSGGVAAARSGQLTFMVGGPEASFLKAEAILKHMGKAVIHAGLDGAGQAAKACNNMLLAITMIGTCEAFQLANRLGLDAQVFFDIASKASGQNWSMTSYCPVAGPVDLPLRLCLRILIWP
jgi:3-hydroxyisobutyrate dehydrogenase